MGAIIIPLLIKFKIVLENYFSLFIGKFNKINGPGSLKHIGKTYNVSKVLLVIFRIYFLPIQQKGGLLSLDLYLQIIPFIKVSSQFGQVIVLPGLVNFIPYTVDPDAAPT
mgnify:CR=1 FL=1